MATPARAGSLTGSFKPEFAQRPDGYRTPPPPEFEPLSPILYSPSTDPVSFTNSKKRKLNTIWQSAREDYSDAKSCYNGPYHNATLNKGRNGSIHSPEICSQHRQDASLSPLDVFATVATSPSLDSRLFPNDDQPVQSVIFDRNHLSRQPHHRHSKRTRSEQIHQDRQAISESSRPATSHVAQAEWGYQEEHPSLVVGVPIKSEVKNGIAMDTPAQPPGAHEATVLEAELLLGFAMSNRESGLLTSSHTAHAPLFQPPYPQTYTEFPEEGTSSTYGAFASYKNSVSTDPSIKTKMDPSDQASAFIGAHSIRPSSTLGEGSINVTQQAQEQYTQKPKAHKGWPKGKPRGPRNTITGGKKTSQQRKKRATETKNTRGFRKLDVTKKDTDSPWQLNAAEQSRMRRFSTSEVVRTSKAKSNEFPERRSVPPDIPMVVKNIRQGPGRPRVRKLPTINICPKCGLTDNSTNGYHNSWIGCNGCRRWFHSVCAGFEKESVLRDVDKYFCADCQPTYGKSTFVRKSARAHASVDYAGLNEGNLRTAVDVPEHHYIKPIKDGTLELTPETFPRMPPELVTADYFERSGGMTEPVLIPAHLNPRPENATSSVREGLEEAESTVEDFREDHATVHLQGFRDDLEYDCVFDEGQDKLGMVIPTGLTIRKVSDLYGPDERVEVIDVKLQEGEDRRWTMRQWADYYEAEGEKPVRNVISLEVSQSKLGRLIKRPLVVRNLDLQDAVWPLDEQAKGSFPKVQFYCLMSVADCYTDFHIDFGGSSVYYHILKGRKTFFFIPPKPQHLKKYEEWCLSPNQNQIWLGNETKECYRVDLYPGDTMLIPSGWIHAVWTPENSLVIGGNFLTRMHYSMQLQINEIEKNTGVGKKFRYPYFQRIMWYSLVQYLQEDPLPSTVAEHLLSGNSFRRDLAVYHTLGKNALGENEKPEFYNARYYSKAEIDGLPDLLRFLLRTVMIATGNLPGISKTSQEAVVKSMPKGYGDHVDLIKIFAMWIAWKRGNEAIPSWAYQNATLSDLDILSEKKTSAAAIKAAERQAAREAFKASSERRNLRSPPVSVTPLDPHGAASPGIAETKGFTNAGDLFSGQQLQKLACDDCRQRRVRCKHRDNESWLSNLPKQFGIRQVYQPPSPSSDGGDEISKDASHLTKFQQDTQRTILDQQSATIPSATEGVMDVATIVEPSSSAPKRPRTKACEECRKSKRRCVHDENGRIDPVKASETPVPRGSRRARVDATDGILRDVKGTKQNVETSHFDHSSIPPRPTQYGAVSSFSHFTPPPVFKNPGSSPFNPMSIATSGSIPGLFLEPSSAFDEMRSWSQQPIDNSRSSDKPGNEIISQGHDSPSPQEIQPDNISGPDAAPQTESTRSALGDMDPQGQAGNEQQFDESTNVSSPSTLIMHGRPTQIQSVEGIPDFVDTSVSVQAPPFSPVTDTSLPSPVTMGPKDGTERTYQSQSRTPSIPAHTNTTDSNGRTASNHSSPLTEPDPMSNRDATEEDGQRRSQVTDGSQHLSALRAHEDHQPPVEVNEKPWYVGQNLKAESMEEVAHSVVEPKAKGRPNSRSMSQELSVVRQIRRALPGEFEGESQSPFAIQEESEDARFARLLQEEEFGLRRRRS